MTLPILDTIPPVPPAAPCRLGCTACCHGPFDISASEAALVHGAVAALPSATRAEVLARARAQLVAMQALQPAWQAPWNIAALDEATFDALVSALATVPCPALDPVRGACLIHDARPSTCRLMGMGVVTPEGDLLGNLCPIRDDFPGYAELPPVPLDLEWMECELEARDKIAATAGWVATTIAGAIDRRPIPSISEGSR